VAVNKKGFMVFMISGLVTTIVLGGIFSVVLLYNKTKLANIKQEKVEYVSEYIPRAQENINILVIGCEEINLPPSFMIVFSYDAVKGSLYVTPLPCTMKATVGVREDTINGHYDYSGTHGGVSAAESALLIDIDRYVRLDKAGIEKLIDFCGGVEYEIEKPITLKNEQLQAGKQLLDGRRVSALLFCENEHKSSIEWQAEITTLLINQKLGQKLVADYDNFVSTFFAVSETNMNQYDFALRKKGIQDRLGKRNLNTTSLVIKGEESSEDNCFIPEETSQRKTIEALQEIKDE